MVTVISLNGNSYQEGGIVIQLNDQMEQDKKGITVVGGVPTTGTLNAGLDVPSLRYLFQHKILELITSTFSENRHSWTKT